jgi:hypothetical protein
LNVTVPVEAVPGDVTVAVKVTGCRKVEGLAELVKSVAVLAFWLV